MCALVLSANHTHSQGFDSFDKEAERATKALNCTSPKITPAKDGLGRLYGCVVGKAQTVKLFINEEPGTGRVANVKLIWNDWHKDGGFGTHADKDEASKFVIAFAQLYIGRATETVAEFRDLFFKTDAGKVRSRGLITQFTYRRGPQIDERILVASPRSIRKSFNVDVGYDVSDSHKYVFISFMLEYAVHVGHIRRCEGVIGSVSYMMPALKVADAMFDDRDEYKQFVQKFVNVVGRAAGEVKGSRSDKAFGPQTQSQADRARCALTEYSVKSRASILETILKAVE